MDEEASRQSPPAPSAQPAPSPHASIARERYGPVSVERLVKDDGRALLIYARAEDRTA